MEQEPTVGRIVHFFDNTFEERPPRAAIVTFVWSPTMVNLTVFNADGGTEARSSVVFDNGGSSVYAFWPERAG